MIICEKCSTILGMFSFTSIRILMFQNVYFFFSLSLSLSTIFLTLSAFLSFFCKHQFNQTLNKHPLQGALLIALNDDQTSKEGLQIKKITWDLTLRLFLGQCEASWSLKHVNELNLPGKVKNKTFGIGFCIVEIQG